MAEWSEWLNAGVSCAPSRTLSTRSQANPTSQAQGRWRLLVWNRGNRPSQQSHRSRYFARHSKPEHSPPTSRELSRSARQRLLYKLRSPRTGRRLGSTPSRQPCRVYRLATVLLLQRTAFGETIENCLARDPKQPPKNACQTIGKPRRLSALGSAAIDFVELMKGKEVTII